MISHLSIHTILSTIILAKMETINALQDKFKIINYTLLFILIISALFPALLPCFRLFVLSRSIFSRLFLNRKLEATCRPVPQYDQWDKAYMCDCPAGTVGSVYRWNVNAPHSCITPDEAQLIEWTDTTHFYGYELRYGPVVGLRADGEGIWDYDHRQELYVRVRSTVQYSIAVKKNYEDYKINPKKC